jgi:hypothetical protein
MTRDLAIGLAAGGCAFIVSVLAWSYAIFVLQKIYIDARQFARRDFRTEDSHAQRQ